MNWGKIKTMFIYVFIVLNIILLSFFIYTVEKNSADIVKEKTLNGNGDQWSYTFNDVPKFNQFGDVVY